MSTLPVWIALAAVLAVAVSAGVALALGRTTLRVDAPAGTTPAHPVLLPADPRAVDVDRVRLATTVPGYQRDQTDAVLLALREALARREEEAAELRAELDRLRSERPTPEAATSRAVAGPGPDDAPGGPFGEVAPHPR